MPDLPTKLKFMDRRRVSDLAVRGFAVATFAVLGWVIADTLRAGGEMPAGRNRSELANSTALLPPPGHWSFEGMTWNAGTGQFGWTYDGNAIPAPPLAALPHGSRRAAARWSNNGKLLMEVVTLPEVTDAETLIAHWEASGWSVQASRVRQGDEFSYLLSRDDTLLFAWSANPPDAMDSVMLVDQSSTRLANTNTP